MDMLHFKNSYDISLVYFLMYKDVVFLMYSGQRTDVGKYTNETLYNPLNLTLLFVQIPEIFANYINMHVKNNRVTL